LQPALPKFTAEKSKIEDMIEELKRFGISSSSFQKLSVPELKTLLEQHFRKPVGAKPINAFKTMAKEGRRW